VRAKADISIACFSALLLVLCAESGLQAQVPAPPSQPTSNSGQDSANELSVAVGKTVLVDLARPISKAAIGLGDVAEIDAVSPTEVMVNGKTPGETSLIIWDTQGGRQFFNVSVRASSSLSNDSLEAVRRELRTELPGQPLRVSSESGMIFLRGTVNDITSSQRAVEIAATAGKVVNLLNVNIPAADPQILLKVRFMSVDRSLEKQLGINLFSTGLGNTIAGVSTGQFSPPSLSLPSPGAPAAAALGSGTNILGFYPGLNFGASIEALETKGVVETLAEPNILASNGREASFLAGGEYPYPVAQAGSGGGAATVTIEFKEFGIRLNFIPTFTPRGTIRLQVAPEVSALDFTNAIQISGFEVPAITSRKMKTEVELGDGQSFVLAGLLDNEETESFLKVPFIGDIPFIGKLFQSIQRTKKNTELIVIVTPEIVAPIQAGAPVPDLKYPVKFLPPNTGIPMNTPDAKTAANTPAPAPATIPVEKLIDSMKPEQPLIIEGASGSFGQGSSTSGGASGGGAPTAPTPVPGGPQ
jgi:pilus assembly protein CpaC